MGMIGLSTARITQASLNNLSSNKIALQAQQYAATKASIINATKYDNLVTQNKTQIPNSNFYDEVIIGQEELYPGNDEILQKECSINIYNKNELLPRYSLKVIKTSKSIGSSLPIGSIIPWYGNLNNMPNGFVLCDGKNGTPDLRGKFIAGAGSEYKLSDTGGENEVKLQAEQSVSHFHYFGYNKTSNNGQFPCIREASTIPVYPTVNGVKVTASKWNGSNGGNWWGWDSGGADYLLSNLVTSVSYGLDASKPHENRPPFYALYYIMRLE